MDEDNTRSGSGFIVVIVLYVLLAIILGRAMC